MLVSVLDGQSVEAMVRTLVKRRRMEKMRPGRLEGGRPIAAGKLRRWRMANRKDRDKRVWGERFDGID